MLERRRGHKTSLVTAEAAWAFRTEGEKLMGSLWDSFQFTLRVSFLIFFSPLLALLGRQAQSTWACSWPCLATGWDEMGC